MKNKKEEISMMKKQKSFLQSEKTLRLFSTFGIIDFIIVIIVLTIIGALRTGYNPLTQYMSELGETGAPFSRLASILFIIVGVLLGLFSYALYKGIKKEKISWIGPLLLALFSLFDWIGSGIFPCDPGCAGETFSGGMHLLVGLIGMIFMVACPILTWSGMKKDEKWQRVNTFSLIIGILVPVFFVTFWISYATGTLIGLTQRILYWVFITWIFILALKLLKIFKH
jgi:hypothetical membrane protein